MRIIPFALALALAVPASAQEHPERVVMQLNDFLRLYEQTKDRPEKPEQAPRHFAVPSARYSGSVIFENDEPRSAVFDSKFRVDVLRDKGWVQVPLLPATVAVEKATIAGKEAPVVLQNGWYTLVTDQKGSFDVDIRFAASVMSSQGQSSLSFQLAPSAGTTVELAVPSEEELDFTVANARVQETTERRGQKVVTATLPATGSLAVSWQREIPEEVVETQDSRVYAEVFTLVGLGDGLLEATSTIHHTILFEGVEQLQAQIPDGMTLLDVQGTGIRDWSVDEAGLLTVELNYAAEGAYPLTLKMEQVVGQGSVTATAPIAKPVGVERSKGWLGVEARGNLEISSGDVQKATPIDVRALPGAILGVTGQPVLLGYKYLAEDPTIPLAVTEHDDVDVLVTLLDQAQARTMWTRDGRRITSVRYQVRNNRKQFLRFEMPEGAELWSASVGGKAVQPAKAGDGRVLIPLIRSVSTGGALAAYQVEVVYVEDGAGPSSTGTGSFEAVLPKADVPTTYVGWTVYAPFDAKIPKKSYDGSLRHVDYLSNVVNAAEVTYIETATPNMQASAAQQTAGGALGQGAAPVQVSLPLEGQPIFFEKLLALDEDLSVSFDFKGLKD
ncbi:MAG: hypothetical protein EP330_20185 [Deltaproteobacteria bacterium]|nr:MAG: hypothetical protein EP330_20185 [Deltaproteobacteria bacterium]